MLNDVHPPPLEPEYSRRGSRNPVMRSTPHRHDAKDRPHELERQSAQSEGIDLIYPEPEDRGDSFNTTMSAIIVSVVLVIGLAILLSFWWG